MAKLMSARYAGTCKLCPAGIKIGDAILYGGRGNVRHTDCSRPTGTAEHVCNVTCSHDDDNSAEDYSDDLAMVAEGRIPYVGAPSKRYPRSSRRYRSWSGRTDSEGTFFRGCGHEDYPCCGCES
jgi:hypothetical protein